MDLSIAGKVALVTGAASGIGRVSARRLALEGAAVVVVDRDADGAEQTAAMILETGGRAVAFTADIAREEDNRAMFEAAESHFGGTDMAFLNAGIDLPYSRFRDTDVGMLDKVFAVNLRGVFLGMHLAHWRLRTGGACLVTASMAGLSGISEVAPYSAVKHGVIGLVKSAARDFADRGLRVNALCPGYTYTKMTGFAQDDSIAGELAMPQYRGGMSAQHMAEVALFLLSHRANGINGHAQLVDAGVLAALPPLEALTLPGERNVESI